ncbi:MAG: sulfite exporter TauE/SafE family protein [Candidatus Woesebacteria bacterium]|nr:sulfite exporter TauE/SafE family protein [Candidatus Woesebacteria bacterium]
MANYWLAFITGLTTGGISCFAVQGGLLTSALATDEEINISKSLRAKALTAFLISKLIAYTILGFVLGTIGKNLLITPKVQGWLQIIIGIYMIITAANLANLHPFFRHFVITPPKFVFKLLRNQTKVKSFFTPVLLGALTILIPCGVTQAMMLLAISASNPVVSASIMFAFILGTIPVFFMIGLAANELFKHKALAVIAALVVAGMGILSINSGQVLRGSPHTIQNYWKVAFESDTADTLAVVNSGVQEVTINVSAHGYKADVNTLKVGVPVRLTLITNGVASCARAFTVPDYNLFKLLPQTGTETMEFTPTKTGLLTYTCSMGMYSGSFNVVE